MYGKLRIASTPYSKQATELITEAVEAQQVTLPSDLYEQSKAMKAEFGVKDGSAMLNCKQIYAN